MQNKKQENIPDQELSEKDLEKVVGGVRIFGIDINLNPTAPEPMPQPSSNPTSNKK